MNYYKLELAYGIIYRDNDGKMNLSNKIMLSDVDKFIEWRDMSKPFEIGQNIKIVSGYHTGRTGKIYGLNERLLWVKVYEVNKMVEMYSNNVRHI